MTSKETEVLKFVSGFVDVPVESLSHETNLLDDISWEKRHPDDSLAILFDEFLRIFKVRVPSQDFSRFRKKHNIPLVFSPFVYPVYVYKYREPVILDDVTIGDLVRAADCGVWPESAGH